MIINGLGTEMALNGDIPRTPDNGDCISNAARFQSASLGMIKLVTMPIFTAVGFWMNEPNCSIQPPMKARPYRPKTTPPVASAGNEVEHMNVMVMTNKA